MDQPEIQSVSQQDDSILAAISCLMPWAMSVVFHVGLLLVLVFLMTVGGPSRVAGEELVAPRVNWVNSPGVEQPDDNDTDRPPSDAWAIDPRPAPAVTESVTPTDATIVAPDANSQKTIGTPPGGGGGGNIFGVNIGGNVRRIVFVVDRSGSMNKHFDYVKTELVEVIGELQPFQQFTIIFYNDAKPVEMVVNGQFGLVYANQATKLASQEWVRQQTAGSEQGRTLSASALQRAVAVIGNQPGLIVLLSEGHIHDNPDKLLAQLNKDKRITVSTIGFVDRIPEGERLLRTIAAQNGGRYRFVSEADLGRSRRPNW